MTFRAAIPDSVPQADVDRGIKQLKALMKVKFGEDCMKENNWNGDFRVVVTDLRTMKRAGDVKMALAKSCSGMEMPRIVSLCVENRRIKKLDPEIRAPEDGDGFADNLKIPEGLELAESESCDDNKPDRKYEDDALFAKALANPQPDYRERMDKTSARYRQLFRTKRELIMQYFRKNPLWNVSVCIGRNTRSERLERVFWAGDQFATLELTTVRPLKDTYGAKKGCKSPEAGWYALTVEFDQELTKLEKLKDESEIDAILPRPKKYVPPKTDFKLIDGLQGGIYRYQATVDTEEDGEVYLRAYEVTKGTRLSADRMKQRTTEKITGKGEHTIGIGKEFTIYEGDWGKFYAARLEIWFVPANGGKPRKLKEKLFKVQGWMF